MPPPDPPTSPPSEADAAALAGALKLAEFFPEFSAELCGKIFPRSGVCSFAAGAALMEQGAPGRDLFVVLQGAVGVSVRMHTANAEVGTVGPGGLLGEIALLRDGTRSATAVAKEPVRAFRLAFADIGYLLEHNQELSAHLQDLARQRTF